MKRFDLTLNILLSLLMLTAISCDDDNDNNNSDNDIIEFTSLGTPYLVCANRNPGGVGFDFEYNGEKGGANSMDSLSVDDFEYDLKIRTIKGEKSDGTQSGAPFIVLGHGAEAVNYSKIDTSCVGITQFNALTTANVKSYTLASDNASFNIASLTTGTTGSPLLTELQVEYKKLVLGESWKATAKNAISEDELVWIMKTQEGQLVKFIVTEFPAKGAPTSTGYVSIEWTFLN